jgi:hypothetical protein
MKILLREVNIKVGREDIFKPTIENGSSHDVSNENTVRVVNFATSKNLSRVQWPHIATFINTLRPPLGDRKTQNQIDHFLID